MNIFRFIRLMSAFAMIVLVAPPAFAVHDLDLFELEGDAFEDDNIDGDDWNTVNLFGGGAAFETTGLVDDTAPASMFTGGGSKTVINNW